MPFHYSMMVSSITIIKSIWAIMVKIGHFQAYHKSGLKSNKLKKHEEKTHVQANSVKKIVLK